jgi:hypothetical protein
MNIIRVYGDIRRSARDMASPNELLFLMANYPVPLIQHKHHPRVQYKIYGVVLSLVRMVLLGVLQQYVPTVIVILMSMYLHRFFFSPTNQLGVFWRGINVILRTHTTALHQLIY